MTRAYGLHMDCAFPIYGVAERRAEPPGRPVPSTRVEMGVGDVPRTAWTEILTRRAPDGRRIASIDHHPVAGYRMSAEGWGVFDLAADGSRVTCAPADGLEPWLFHRFLTGQVLPLAALLGGYEIFHASGVGLDGRVIGLAGTCGAGKTSVALNLVLRGASFFSDDVLALDPDPSALLCHPGPAAANVRDGRLRALAQAGVPPFRGVAGASAASLRALVEREEQPLPLGALYFFDHGGDGEIAFEPSCDPFVLIGHTFNVVIRTPVRLSAQLDACARVAAARLMFRVRVPRAMDAADLAESIEEHARSAVAATAA